ncbi:hypothetical protein CsSME_00005925 [Camellia sinensis var. sinensis]
MKLVRGDKLHNLHNESNILDVSSGILLLAGDSLVPESINKNCLEDAKVLQQVDKKFIPIVGGGVLAIIDQIHLSHVFKFLKDRSQMIYLGSVLFTGIEWNGIIIPSKYPFPCLID